MEVKYYYILTKISLFYTLVPVPIPVGVDAKLGHILNKKITRIVLKV